MFRHSQIALCCIFMYFVPPSGDERLLARGLTGCARRGVGIGGGGRSLARDGGGLYIAVLILDIYKHRLIIMYILVRQGVEDESAY